MMRNFMFFGVFAVLAVTFHSIGKKEVITRGLSSSYEASSNIMSKGFVICEEAETEQDAIYKINKRLIPDENNHILGSIASEDGGVLRVLTLDASSGVNISKPVIIDQLANLGIKVDTPYMMRKDRRFKHFYSMVHKSGEQISKNNLLKSIMAERFHVCVSVSAD